MCSLDKLFSVLNDFAPLSISEACKMAGDYDNSGILVRCSDNANKILFSLDLSREAVRFAKRNKCDTIVTHHPAIYMPIKSLSKQDETTAPVLESIKLGVNVISMHLNLDLADEGIDYSLAKGLGGKNINVLTFADDKHGYGREYKCGESLTQFVNKIKKELGTQKVIYYGNKNDMVDIVASFCGGGFGYALNEIKKGKVSADTIISSDIKHHELKEMIEGGKKVIIIPHYASEDYGFKYFYQSIKNKIQDGEIIYFSDRRFK